MMSQSRCGVPETSAKYSFSTGARGELLGQLGVSLIVAGDENHAASIAVEAVHNARPSGPAGAAQGGTEMKLQRTGQRARPVSAGRMHHHARRLIDDGHDIVFVEDVERDVFRAGRLAGNLGEHDRDPLTGLEPIGRLTAAAVHPNAAGRNHAPQMHATVVEKMAGQKGVQAVAGFCGSDRQLHRLGRQRHGKLLFLRRLFRGLFCLRRGALGVGRGLAAWLRFLFEFQIGDARRALGGKALHVESRLLPRLAGEGRLGIEMRKLIIEPLRRRSFEVL